MALGDSGRAIGAVTKLLREHLIRRGFAVSVGKPEVAATTDTNAKLNLFLYETSVDASLRNIALQSWRGMMATPRNMGWGPTIRSFITSHARYRHAPDAPREDPSS